MTTDERLLGKTYEISHFILMTSMNHFSILLSRPRIIQYVQRMENTLLEDGRYLHSTQWVLMPIMY